MSLTVSTYVDVPDDVESMLGAHTPYSLPLLRRLQHAKHIQPSPQARTILVSHPDGSLTAAWVDFAGGPDTQMWLYSTLDDESETVPIDHYTATHYTAQLEELTMEILRLGAQYGKSSHYPGALLLGSLTTPVRRLLEKMNRVQSRPSGYYDKWLFRPENLPTQDDGLPPGMRWDEANLSDCQIVVARTNLPRTAENLNGLSSLIIRLDDGTPISWAFLGVDGSLTSLHCEEKYRRRGLAKALASKIMRQGPGDFALDGWGTADVAADNAGSRRICKSLGGEPRWEVSWVLFDISESGCDTKQPV